MSMPANRSQSESVIPKAEHISSVNLRRGFFGYFSGRRLRIRHFQAWLRSPKLTRNGQASGSRNPPPGGPRRRVGRTLPRIADRVIAAESCTCLRALFRFAWPLQATRVKLRTSQPYLRKTFAVDKLVAIKFEGRRLVTSTSIGKADRHGEPGARSDCDSPPGVARGAHQPGYSEFAGPPRPLARAASQKR